MAGIIIICKTLKHTLKDMLKKYQGVHCLQLAGANMEQGLF
jgi:hypothetical protein